MTCRKSVNRFAGTRSRPAWRMVAMRGRAVPALFACDGDRSGSPLNPWWHCKA